MRNNIQRHTMVFWLIAICPTWAWAGQNCTQNTKIGIDGLKKSLQLAEKVRQSLDQSKADVVILARKGQDLSTYNVVYSHLGLAYKEPKTHHWRILHELNLCNSNKSAIYVQGLAEFFSDDLWRYEAAYVVPAPTLQKQLLAFIQSPQRAQFHHNNYSAVSYAWGHKYQQSNQWALETLAGSMDSTITNRTQAQHWLRVKEYKPTQLTIYPLTRLAARMSKANVAFDDHPIQKRFSDRIETVTVDSVFDWMQKTHLSTDTSPVVVF